jgi:hypothetical protein
MNCPTCKNPIEGRSTICEWCEASLEPQSNNSIRNNSNNLASAKAIKYTIYVVFVVLSWLLIFFVSLEMYPFFLLGVFVIITIELYTYLKNRFSK